MQTTRIEHDLLGEREVPAQRYFGIQTLRAVENFAISGIPIAHYPRLIKSLAYIKKAAASPTGSWACSTQRLRTRSPAPVTIFWPARCTTSSWWTSSRAAPGLPQT